MLAIAVGRESARHNVESRLSAGDHVEDDRGCDRAQDLDYHIGKDLAYGMLPPGLEAHRHGRVEVRA